MKKLIIALALLFIALAIILIYFGSVSYDETEVEGCNNSIKAMEYFRNLSYIVAIITVLLWLYAFFKPFAGKIFRGKDKKTQTIFLWHIVASAITTGLLMLVFYLTNISDMRRMISDGLQRNCKDLVEPSSVFIFSGLPFPFSLIIEVFLFIILFAIIIVYIDLFVKKIRK